MLDEKKPLRRRPRQLALWCCSVLAGAHQQVPRRNSARQDR